VKNGLLNNVIHSIVEDDMHNIWASTSCGIGCIYIKNNVIKQVFCFSRGDNVPNETFVDAKVLKLDNGQIVMQAIDHVVTFQPAEFLPFFEQEAYSMQTKLTKLMVNGIDVTAGGKVNGDVVLEKAITRTKEIDLNYDQNSISMTFSALNFARPLQTFYRVRVRELSPNWREFSYFDSKGMVDSKGLLHLPLLALEAGTYHVEVQASVVKGKFVGTPYEWIVNVNQPWWRTTGIMAVFGLIVLALAVLNVIIFNRNTRLRMKRNNEEGDVIRRIKVFVERCENFSSDKLSPTQEEIYGTDKDSQVEVSNEFVEVMLKVIPFVQERNGRPFSMYMLSKVTDMELRDLYEMVLDNIYKSPRALIRSMRIDQVADQLLTTDKTIEDIATDCGFVSPNYMIAKFFHKYRMTPAEYREEYSE
jgi:AraC-like DNA-binding protein